MNVFCKKRLAHVGQSFANVNDVSSKNGNYRESTLNFDEFWIVSTCALI